MSPTANQTPPSRPAPGMTVTSKFNEGWGAGTVLTVQGERAQVLFTQHPARKPVVVPCKSLVITRPGAWDAAVQAVQQRERTASVRSSTGGSKKKRTYATTTQDEAIKLFLERFPGGFAGEAYQTTDRKPKWDAHLAFEEHLGGDKLKALVSSGRVEEVLQHALQAEQPIKLLSVFDRARLSQAFKADAEYAGRVVAALADVLAHDAPEEKSFTQYLELLAAAPAKNPGQRSITWPIATILPYLARPTQFLFLKPVATQAAAERLKFDLQYQAALQWSTYQQALRLAEQLQAALAEHGCRDLMDVQSFLWAVK